MYKKSISFTIVYWQTPTNKLQLLNDKLGKNWMVLQRFETLYFAYICIYVYIFHLS